MVQMAPSQPNKRLTAYTEKKKHAYSTKHIWCGGTFPLESPALLARLLGLVSRLSRRFLDLLGDLHWTEAILSEKSQACF